MFRKKLSNSAKNIRVIVRLDIKGSNVVKPVMAEALKVVGNPRELARRYYKEGADELVYMDIVASLYNRNLDLEQLQKVTEGIFIPITVGGGIRSIGDINNALRAGADKVAINTYAINHPQFLRQAVETFGAQCIVLSVDANKEAIKMGVGEVMVASIDREGTRKGFDLELAKSITAFSPVPVIVHGGAGSLDSIRRAIVEGSADAISASSIFHYKQYMIEEVKVFLSHARLNVRLS